ncbi:MAG: hypothetical protein RLZZ28_2422, partial [Bacteroidota bacterium]
MKLFQNIDKLGAAGLFITALFSPCCFPLFAFALTGLGLGSFELFGGWTMWVFQIMVLITIIGLFIAYRRNGNRYPLMLAIVSGGLIFYGYHFNESDHWIWFLYAGMFGQLMATLWNFRYNKRAGTCDTCINDQGKELQLSSTITCPHCGHSKTETMPTDACMFFYECEQCHARLKPLEGDCCVFCSYGTV